MPPFVDILNFNEKEESTCIKEAILLELSFFKILIIVPILSVCTVFIFAVVLYWKKNLQRQMLFWKVSSLKKASYIYIKGMGDNVDIFKIRDNTRQSQKFIGQNENLDPEMEPMTIFFTYRFIKFVWNAQHERFEPIKFSCTGKKLNEMRAIFANPARVSNESLRKLQTLKFGQCEVAVPRINLFSELIDYLLSPFYLFQLFAVTLWFWQGYEIYAGIIVGI